MKRWIRFNKVLFVLALLLFLTEVFIALYVRDDLIRPYGGDLLVVIFIYCVVRAFLRTPVVPTVIAVLLFAYLIEAGQYFGLIYLLGLENSSLARTVIGIGFDWKDLLAYTIGALIILIINGTIFVSMSSGKES